MVTRWPPGTPRPKPRRQHAPDAREYEHREAVSNLENGDYFINLQGLPGVDDQTVLQTPLKRIGRQSQHRAVDAVIYAIGPSVDHPWVGMGASGVGKQQSEPGRLESGPEAASPTTTPEHGEEPDLHGGPDKPVPGEEIREASREAVERGRALQRPSSRRSLSGAVALFARANSRYWITPYTSDDLPATACPRQL